MRPVYWIIMLSLLLGACAGRIPSTESAHSLTKNYFKSYGKKFDKSIFGSSPVERVGINSIRQQARHLSEIDAILTFSNGQMARVLLTTKKTPPLGWSVQSWELLGLQ